MTRTTRLDRDALDQFLSKQLDVIARHQTQAAGMSDNALRHRLRREGPWSKLLPGVYMTSWSRPREKRHDAGFVRLHRTTRMPARIWERGPIRYVPPTRAVADTVRQLSSLRDVRAIVADAVQRRACQVRDLAAELAAGPRTGSGLFREALADVTDGIRSTAEADLKDLLVKAKIPLPLFNPELYDKDGTFIARPDAWWPDLGIAIEVDSREWHLSPQDHENTLARGRRMGRYQIVVLRVTPRQLREERATVINDIRDATEASTEASTEARSQAAKTELPAVA